MFTLYYAPTTCALAVHIVLEEIGAPYEAARLHFSQNEQRKPDYLAVNPKGRVPALVSERGVLTETRRARASASARRRRPARPGAGSSSA